MFEDPNLRQQLRFVFLFQVLFVQNLHRAQSVRLLTETFAHLAIGTSTDAS